MAERQIRFRNDLFTNKAGVYGSHDYTVALEDMPDYPFRPKVIDAHVPYSTDGGDIHKYHMFIKVQVGLNFVDCSRSCVATLGSLFTDRTDFLFYEDTNSSGAQLWFPSGTGTCTFAQAEFDPNEQEYDLYSPPITIIEVAGRLNEA